MTPETKKRKRIRETSWYPAAMAACIAVILFIILYRLPVIWGSVITFIGFFKAVILGCVIAYIVNPLARFFGRLFKGIKRESLRNSLSIALAFVVVILFLTFALFILIPQLVESIETFVGNLDGYIVTVNAMIESWGISKSTFDLSNFISSSESLLSSISTYVADNLDNIVAVSANVGKNLLQWLIAFILSIYLLAGRDQLVNGMNRLLKAIFGEERYGGVRTFLRRCDDICTRYIVYNLIDSLIVGAATAIFMAVCGMQYAGLVAFVVGLTNLVPTFGPVVGAVIGAFVLLMVKPSHALVFLIFALVLQLLDGYIIKPKLFGNSLGVSGLWILIGIVVGGNMFGLVGILLAIPGVAILDLIYKTYLVPGLEARWERREAMSVKTVGADAVDASVASAADDAGASADDADGDAGFTEAGTESEKGAGC